MRLHQWIATALLGSGILIIVQPTFAQGAAFKAAMELQKKEDAEARQAQKEAERQAISSRGQTSIYSSNNSSSGSPELCAIAYQIAGKSTSYYENLCYSHPRPKEKWICVIDQMRKGNSMFYAESYCGA